MDIFPAGQQGHVRAMFANPIQGVISQRLLPLKDSKGRVAAMEIMIATTAVRNLIREQKTHQLPSILQTNAAIGMQTMDQALKELLQQGLISEEVALAQATDLKSIAG